MPNPTPATHGTVSNHPMGNDGIWINKPAIMQLLNQSYLGRLFVEVWEVDLQVVSTGAGVLERSLSALRGEHIRVPRHNIPWLDISATGGGGPDDPFLGTVIVEVWQNDTVVGLIGSNDDRVLQRATAQLDSLYRAQRQE